MKRGRGRFYSMRWRDGEMSFLVQSLRKPWHSQFLIKEKEKKELARVAGLNKLEGRRKTA